MTPVSLTTRRPTGKPPWPIVLIAGAEKSGKSWACAAASSSDLIGRTLWYGMGEDDPDEYAHVEGADFEIVEHDGTYRGFMNALLAGVQEPRTDGKPTLIVVDSMTRLWNVLTDMAQQTANERARKKGKGDVEADISMDLWNLAKNRWANVMDTLRDHDGPVLLTARLDEVTVMQNGRPTTDKALKVQAEKSLPYDVGAVVEMPERGKAYLKGVRSARLQLPERMAWPSFTVDELWRRLGLDEADATAPRQHPKPAAVDEPPAAGDGGEAAPAAGARPQGQHRWEATPPQKRKMFALLREKGYGDREAGLLFVSSTLGLADPIASSDDLSMAQVSAVIDALLDLPAPEPTEAAS